VYFTRKILSCDHSEKIYHIRIYLYTCVTCNTTFVCMLVLMLGVCMCVFACVCMCVCVCVCVWCYHNSLMGNGW